MQIWNKYDLEVYNKSSRQNPFISFIFILGTIILVSWIFDKKTTFYFLLLLVFGFFVYRFNEFKGLIQR